MAARRWLPTPSHRQIHQWLRLPNRPRAKVPTGWSIGTDRRIRRRIRYGYRLTEPDGSHQYGKFPFRTRSTTHPTCTGARAAKIVREQAKRPGPFYMQVEFLAPARRDSAAQAWGSSCNPGPTSTIPFIDGDPTIPPRPALRHRNSSTTCRWKKTRALTRRTSATRAPSFATLPLLTSDQIDDRSRDNRARRRSLFAVDEAITKVIHELKKTKQGPKYRHRDDGRQRLPVGSTPHQHGQSTSRMSPHCGSHHDEWARHPVGIRLNQSWCPSSTWHRRFRYGPCQGDRRKPDGMSLRRTLAGLGSPARAVCFLSSGPQRGPNGEYLPLYDGVRKRELRVVALRGLEEM